MKTVISTRSEEERECKESYHFRPRTTPRAWRSWDAKQADAHPAERGSHAA
jgi:hypothetical protein